MANLAGTTYSKRPPLATLSNNVPITKRQSTRLRFDSSDENCHNSEILAPSKIFVQACHSPEDQALFPIVEVSSTSCCPAEPVVESTVTLETKHVAIVPSKRTQRVPKPRALHNVSRTKKKMTLEMHVEKYRSTHEIE